MALCRIWYRADGRVFIQHIDYKLKPTGMADADFAVEQFAIPRKKNPDKYNTMEFEDVDDSTLPNGVSPISRKDRDRWRGTKATGVKIDNTVVLRKDLEKEMDDELAKPNPDLKKVMQTQRKLDKKEHD